MSVRSALRPVLLGLSILAVAAFVISFIAGIATGPGARGDDPAAEALVLPREPRVRVEILNAAGRAGLARDATDRLRDRGFDVVYFGNARDFGRDSSVVLDRTGQSKVARAVARALGIDAVRAEPDSSLLLEVTVILGTDWPPPGNREAAGWGARLGRLWRRRGEP